jgi:hypothetical protein
LIIALRSAATQAECLVRRVPARAEGSRDDERRSAAMRWSDE